MTVIVGTLHEHRLRVKIAQAEVNADRSVKVGKHRARYHLIRECILRIVHYRYVFIRNLHTRRPYPYGRDRSVRPCRHGPTR